MSRCFPFPPPGYEKKLNVDDANLLAKAKQKEKKDKDKKHKKDKKDKDKKEGKEKDKDRSKEKRKDKKEKKEKHRDKSHEKKNNLSDEKRIETLGEGSLRSNHFAEASCVQELAKRIRDEDSATGIKTVERNAFTPQKQVGSAGGAVANAVDRSERKDMSKDNGAYKKIVNAQRDGSEIGVRRVAIVHSFGGVEQKRVDMVKPMEKDVKKAVEKNEKERPYVGASVKDDKRFNRQTEPSNGKNVGPDRIQSSQIKQNGFVQEFGDVRDEHALAKSLYVGKSTWSDQKGSGSMGEMGFVGRSAETNTSNGNGLVVKANGQSDKPRGPKLSFVHSRGAGQGKVEGIKRTADGKEKSKVEEVELTANRGLVGKQTAKIGGGIVDRIKGQLVREGGEPNKKALEVKEVVREVENGSKLCLSKGSNKVVVPGESAKKRKQPEVNGFLLDGEVRPSKLQRTPSSRRLSIENGRKPHQASPAHSAPIEKANATNKPQAKEHKLNGITDPPRPTVKLAISPSQSFRSSTTSTISQPAQKEKETKINGFIDQSHSAINSSVSSSAVPKSEKSRKAPSVKPPHPDSKCLNLILSVPKLEEATEPETDDWLFTSNPKPSSSLADEAQEQVWDKALHIQSADIAALPYVIPY